MNIAKKFYDKNLQELKAGDWVVSEGDKPSIIVKVTNAEPSYCSLGIDATNYDYYKNRHNRMVKDTRNGEELFGSYKPKVEEAYPLTEFSLKRNGDEGFILVDYVKCEKPENAIIPEGVF